jgi:spermidine synthase
VIKIAGGAGGDLMSTRQHGSEDALAEIACKKIAHRPHPRVLIGGLGMGFTLASALRHLGGNAEVVVAELVPAVVAWNRGIVGRKAGHPLQDKRASVHEIDVALILRAERQGYDAILLDVDNGPAGLSRKDNDWLYSMEGLLCCRQALRPQGVLAVWSAGPDRKFTERLKKAGFRVEELQVHAHGRKGTRHTLWMATL